MTSSLVEMVLTACQAEVAMTHSSVNSATTSPTADQETIRTTLVKLAALKGVEEAHLARQTEVNFARFCQS